MDDYSTSAMPTKATTVSGDIARLYECQVCSEYVQPPILQCHTGRLICSNCRPEVTCPICMRPLGIIRNLAMEKLASIVLFPCKYSTSGCAETLRYTERREHEQVCEFRPYSCPCRGASCKWQGSLEEVMPHLVKSHDSIPTLQGEDVVLTATDINLPGRVDWVHMQSCFGHHFVFVLEKQENFGGDQKFFAMVQLIGSVKQAENFEYKLELNDQGRPLAWGATTRSIHEGVSSAIMNSHCLKFDSKVAQHLADDGKLSFLVSISMV